MSKKICVIGLGYVGLPTAILLAERGVNIIGCDINSETVANINQGKARIKETNLDEMLSQAVSSGNLKAFTIPARAEAFIIAVPTPIQANKSPDLTYIIDATTSLAPFLEKGNLIILESTSPVGSTRMLAEHLSRLRPDLNFTNYFPDVLMAYCPERILPGNAFEELVNNSRSIGGLTTEAALAAQSIYSIFCNGELLITNAETAEFSKLVENSFRDVSIAFANELSLICEKQKINVHEVITLANKHPRVNILNPGIGVGGHCIPVDPWFIVHASPDESKLIHMARLINDNKPEFVAQKIIEAAQCSGVSRIGMLGLSYKPDVDDFRESPAFTILKRLSENQSLSIQVHDPYFHSFTDRLPKNVQRMTRAQTLIDEVDILLISTPHRNYAECNFHRHLLNGTLMDPSDFVIKNQKTLAIQKVVSEPLIFSKKG